MNILLPHDPVTLLITYGNIHDIVARHKLMTVQDLKKILAEFRPDCPREWVDLIFHACPRSFQVERGHVWLKHVCNLCPETCTKCREMSDEIQVLLLMRKN